jgi:hypothetical protein
MLQFLKAYVYGKISLTVSTLKLLDVSMHVVIQAILY